MLMRDREASVVVTLPAQIDVTCQDQVYDQLYAAFAADAPVVIADFTGTVFCDCSALRRLCQVRHRAVALGAAFRLVIPPGSLAHRLTAMIGTDRVLPVYSSVPAAMAAEQDAGLAAGPALGRPGPGAAVADITDLVRASHRHIAHWQARLGQLRRHAGPGADPDLAAAWDTVAALIDLHMRAGEEICGPVVCRAAPDGAALAGEIRDAHADLREVIAETGLQRPGSLRWRDLAATALSAWTRHCDDAGHGPAAAWLHRADPALRRLLGRQWRAFREAWIRDLYPDAPPRLATCELRLARPATPRLADPSFAPLSCTCQACTAASARSGRPPSRRPGSIEGGLVATARR